MGKCVRDTLKERYDLILQTVRNVEDKLLQMPEGRIIIRKIGAMASAMNFRSIPKAERQNIRTKRDTAATIARMREMTYESPIVIR